MKNQYPFYTLCLALTMLTACSGEKKESASEKGVETVLPDTKNEVSVMTLKKQIFNHELVSNGKISARGMADLRFESGEVIAHIWTGYERGRSWRSWTNSNLTTSCRNRKTL